MTPKEKAKELVDKYMFMEVPNYVSKFEIKLCALIAVNELIKLYEYERPHRGFKISYWDEVKQEIELL
jgi:hypothetical protein